MSFLFPSPDASHVHIPCLAAGADLVTGSPPALPHRTPRSLWHPFPAPGAGGTACPAAGITPRGLLQGPPSPTTGCRARTARSRERWLRGWGWVWGGAGTARGHQRLDGTGEMEGVHQAASLGKHGMGSRQVLFVTRLRGLRAINTVCFFKGSELAIGNACCLGDLEVFFKGKRG